MYPGIFVAPSATVILNSSFSCTASGNILCAFSKSSVVVKDNVITSPPIPALSSSEVPSATTNPSSIIAIRSANSSASSRYCVVRIIVTPLSRSLLISSHSTLLEPGSKPVVGSSKNSISGECTRLSPRSNLLFIPPEYVLTLLSPASVSPTSSKSSLVLVSESALE